MITTISLKEFLKTNELEEGTTLIVKTGMFRPLIGKFLEMENDEYKVEMTKTSVLGKTPFIHINYLEVPVNVQKFFVLSPDSSDIEELLK